MYLEAFGVKNLRCLTDTGLVPIRPITLLVGRNSSGKSTFLRAFPLLRQSVETARNSPVLWYDERYVDFGSLQAAANNRLSEPSVTFQARLRLPIGRDIAVSDPTLDVAMTLEGRETPYVRTYEVTLEGTKFRWVFDAIGRVQNLDVNGKVVGLDETFSLGGKRLLLPNIKRDSDELIDGHVAPAFVRYNPIEHQTATFAAYGSTLYLINRELRNVFQGEDAHAMTVDVAASRTSIMLEIADFVLAHVFSRVSYLAPLRVSAQRAYRIQNLAVDEVDPDGTNLAMFLRALSPGESESFANFTRTALGFETQINTTGIHAEILINASRENRFVNLVDVGFGYSEVLPLAAVLWANCIRLAAAHSGPAPLLAIEQPELHLHPAHQAKIARMLVEAVSASRAAGVTPQLIVETHSESLINGLGRLVYEGQIKAEDIQIVLFDQDDETGDTSVRFAGYRESGALRDWPYGFLSPVAERRLPPAAE